jgi:hypothetical protein
VYYYRLSSTRLRNDYANRVVRACALMSQHGEDVEWRCEVDRCVYWPHHLQIRDTISVYGRTARKVQMNMLGEKVRVKAARTSMYDLGGMNLLRGVKHPQPLPDSI